jgi:hypothetical protein
MSEAHRIQTQSGGRIISLEEMRAAPLLEALRVWNAKRGDRCFPARESMTPRDMRPFLPNITLWRKTADGTDYEYRLMGEVDSRAYRTCMTGLYVSDLDRLRPGNGSLVKAVLDWVVRKGKPTVSAGWLVTSREIPVFHEMLFLPLGPDDDTVDHVLGVSDHSDG